MYKCWQQIEMNGSNAAHEFSFNERAVYIFRRLV